MAIGFNFLEADLALRLLASVAERPVRAIFD
jgi:hypothetical protein